jgi:hypothetical protein
MHGFAPQVNAVPSPPPQTCMSGHVPHWTVSPQPSPIGPHVASALAHVTRLHGGFASTSVVGGTV